MGICMYINVDVKKIGLMSLVIGIGMLGWGVNISRNMRKLIKSLIKKIKSYHRSVSTHGIMMIFFASMPILISGIGNILIATIVGTNEVTYPKINNISLIILMIGIVVLINSLMCKNKYKTGWTIYPPVSCSTNELNPLAVEYTIIALLISGISSTLTALNIIQTPICLKMKSHVVKLHLFFWSIGITNVLLAVVLPTLTIILVVLLTDISMNTAFFNSMRGGDPVLYQHLFWFFGHPEVYILILPIFGLIISHNLPKYGTNCTKLVIGSIIGIAVIGMFVWVHHMYTSGVNVDTKTFHTLSSLMIGSPTLSKILMIRDSINNE